MGFLGKQKLEYFKNTIFSSFYFLNSTYKYCPIHSFIFFVGIPLFSLLLGWIVWRTKSLSLSSFVHVVINISIVLLG